MSIPEIPAEIIAALKTDSYAIIKWTLECGCEPCFEHCDQCDARRKAREAYYKQAELDRAVERVRAAGYIVSKPL